MKLIFSTTSPTLKAHKRDCSQYKKKKKEEKKAVTWGGPGLGWARSTMATHQSPKENSPSTFPQSKVSPKALQSLHLFHISPRHREKQKRGESINEELLLL